MSAFVKIPLQVLVLMVGVFMFLFYVFNRPPMLFNTEYRERVAQSARAGDYQALEAEFGQAYEKRRAAATALAQAPAGDREPARDAFRAATAEMQAVRGRAAVLVKEVTGVDNYGEKVGDTPKPDVNYVFPTFVTTVA